MKKSSAAGKSGQSSDSNINEHDTPLPGSNSSATPSVLPSPVTSRASSAAGVSRPSSAAAVAFQQASVAYHEAVMAKRLDIVQEMQASLTDTTTVAYQSVAAYSHYLEGLRCKLCCELFVALPGVFLPDHVRHAHNSQGMGADAHMPNMFGMVPDHVTHTNNIRAWMLTHAPIMSLCCLQHPRCIVCIQHRKKIKL